MKQSIHRNAWSFLIAAAAAAACDQEAPLAQHQGAGAARSAPPDYVVTVLDSSLGGRASVPNSIDHRGDPAGWSELAGGATREAVLWRNGRLMPLSTLGGPNSSVQW